MLLKKDSKTKNSSRNIVFGIGLRLYQLILPFAIRTIIIKVLGMEYAGLNSLFTSILSMLNIAELGVGTALVFSMYKPITDDDTNKICALMRLYRLYYRIIGLVILCIGSAITPFLPYLINGDVPSDINLYIIYFLNLGAAVISYWLFAYRNSLFVAHQRNDIVSKITILTDTLKYSVQIVLLLVTKNYYFFLIVALFSQTLSNVITAIFSKRVFPNYVPKGFLDGVERKKLNQSIKDLFYSQFGHIITLSFDSIVISAFLGLVPLAVYNNYYFILNAIISFFLIFYQSLRASIGTNMITKNQESNYRDFKFVSFVVFGILAFCSSCLITMYQPFIEIWVGNDNMLDLICVFLFAAYLIVYEMVLLLDCYKSSTGKWHADRFRPLITALVNLVLNIVLVNIIGIYGVLISTIVSFLFINIPWLYHRLFIDAFDSTFKTQYLLYFLRKTVIIIVISGISFFGCFYLPISNLYVKLVTNLGISTIVSVGLYLLLNIKDDSLKRGISLLKKIFKK